MRTPRAFRQPRVSEKTEQAHGVQLLRSIGAMVYVSGGHRKRGDHQGTMQTPGIPDVEAFLPVRGLNQRGQLLKWECKAVGGRVRPEQAEYAAHCAVANVAHVIGPFDTLIRWLTDHHYVKTDQFPTYRHPQQEA